MSANKPPQLSPPSHTLCSLRTSLLSLAILTLLSFTYLSLKSLHSPPSMSSLNTSSIPLFVSQHDSLFHPNVFHSPNIFHLNYLEMEQKFKIYIYPDGDPNTFYQTPRKLTGKYASEGYFFQNIRESSFLTPDPDQAHLFFIPISCHKMRGKVLKNHCFVAMIFYCCFVLLLVLFTN